jgi:hypothetical protein
LLDPFCCLAMCRALIGGFLDRVHVRVAKLKEDSMLEQLNISNISFLLKINETREFGEVS